MNSAMPTTSTFLDGVLLVVNAIPDLGLVVDSPGCGIERSDKVGARNDLFSTLRLPGLPSRHLDSSVKFPDITLGTESAVVATARVLNSSANPSAIMITANGTIEITGEYHEMAARRLCAELGKPVFCFPSKSLSGDFLDGFGDALAAMSLAISLDPKPIKGHVGIVGFPFDRNERDCQCNLAEIQGLLAALGLSLCGTLPSGQPFDSMRRLSDAEFIVGLPYGKDAAELIASRLGVPLLQLGLPAGIEATGSWIRAVACQAGVSDRAERLIRDGLSDLLPRLRRIVRTTFVGKRLLVALDPYLAEAVVPALSELGMEVASTMVRTRDRQRVLSVEPVLRRVAPQGAISFDAKLTDLNREWTAAMQGGIDLIIGSTFERAALDDDRIPYLELGFPSNLRHALFDAPWMGYRGVLWLADRIYNLLSEHRYLKTSR